MIETGRSTPRGLSEKGEPLNKDMAMGVGSNTKTFTAALVLKLVEQGRLKLDDTLMDVIPDTVSGYSVMRALAVRHLLDHSSGL